MKKMSSLKQIINRLLHAKEQDNVQSKMPAPTNDEHQVGDLEANIPGQYRFCEKSTIADLAHSGKTYWKFTQSREGLSQEAVFAQYEEGKVTKAQDADCWLSFVESENIGKCIGYGDVLSKLDFSENSDFVQEHGADVVIERQNAFGEYTAQCLAVEKNYSLSAPETIAMIIDMSNFRATQMMFLGVIRDFGETLERYGFQESADFFRFIKERFSVMYEQDVQYLKEQLPQTLRDFYFYREEENLDCASYDQDYGIAHVPDRTSPRICEDEKER